MLERDFQRQLIERLHDEFPDAMVLKMDAGYLQGIPDLLVLNSDKWAALECKLSSNTQRRPNQEYYVNKMDDMSYARFVSPENVEVVMHELRTTLV